MFLKAHKKTYVSVAFPKDTPAPLWPISSPVHELFQYLAYDTLNEQLTSGVGRMSKYFTENLKKWLIESEN